MFQSLKKLKEKEKNDKDMCKFVSSELVFFRMDLPAKCDWTYSTTDKLLYLSFSAKCTQNMYTDGMNLGMRINLYRTWYFQYNFYDTLDCDQFE